MLILRRRWAIPRSTVKPDIRYRTTRSSASGTSLRSREIMNDEYGKMDDSGSTYVVPTFTLESGKTLKQVPVKYKTFGKLNSTKDNCMIVCHALTGNASLDSWWGSMLGAGHLFDHTKFFVVCANVLGSCYGTCGPTTINPETGRRYGAAFPDVTVRDNVSLHMKLMKEHLGVKRVACVIGGSLGGMQTLEWALLGGPEYVQSIIAMACGPNLHPWQLGLSEVQRQAIYADPNWNGGHYDPKFPPEKGLNVARQIAMISYRSHGGYGEKFGRKEVAGEQAGHGQDRHFEVEKYLRYQGKSFTGRFDPLSYVKVTRMMDTHDVGRNRGGTEAALKLITQPTMIISISSDALYPVAEQQELHEGISSSEWHIAKSDSGHDGFLLDQDQIEPLCLDFVKRHCKFGDPARTKTTGPAGVHMSSKL
mmetsp:Transcript_11688/g.13509  ORF Transcript_11688/g.13509 Transcript_11688/m.13509 type:complete len:421 (-) Transcript_11688:2023-3285(-)